MIAITYAKTWFSEQTITYKTYSIGDEVTYNNVDYYVGKVLLNKKHELYDKIINTKVIQKNILKNYTNEKKVILISPVHKLEVYYLERTENNFLRHPFIKN